LADTQLFLQGDFAGARGSRTRLGDDGNLMLADGNSFRVFILRWTIGAIGVECDGMTSLSSTRHVASDQSADVSAHSKAALLAASKQLAAS
jgi:hypothetical protein